MEFGSFCGTFVSLSDRVNLFMYGVGIYLDMNEQLSWKV